MPIPYHILKAHLKKHLMQWRLPTTEADKGGD